MLADPIPWQAKIRRHQLHLAMPDGLLYQTDLSLTQEGRSEVVWQATIALAICRQVLYHNSYKNHIF